MKTSEENNIPNPRCSVIDDHVVLSNYITKSPPKEKLNNAFVQWCYRWFILYYNRASKMCCLFYYQNENSYKEDCLPKGRIDVKHSKIKKHNGMLNKYDYVIDVIGVKRTYYLCFTNFRIFESWFKKLSEIHKELWMNDLNNNDVFSNEEENSDVTQKNNTSNDDTKDKQITFNDSVQIIQNEHLPKEDDEDEEEEEEEGPTRQGNETDNDDFNNNQSEGHSQSHTDDNTKPRLSRTISPDRPKTCGSGTTRPSSLDLLDSENTSSAPRGMRKKVISAGVIPQRRLSTNETNLRNNRSESLPGLPLLSPTAGGNIHLQILERLSKAASKRPSLVDDYDMGGFTGPKLSFSGNDVT